MMIMSPTQEWVTSMPGVRRESIPEAAED